MEVSKSLFAVALIFALSACSNEKTVSSVFPEDDALGSSACSGQAVENRFVVQWEDGSYSVETNLNKDSFVEEFVKPQLKKIRFVEFDRKLSFSLPAAETTQQAATMWNLDRVNMESVWQRGHLGQGIRVAVVDSFVDVSHPQINPRILVNTAEIPNNGIDDDQNGVIDDYYGASFVTSPGTGASVSPHGTHVAGTVLADPRFGDVKGAAPEAQLIPIQFISNEGGGFLGDAVMALQYAKRRGAQIVNASWGGAPCVTSLRDAFLDLERSGALIVVAAGNDGVNLDTRPQFPASFSFSNQITVAASTELDIMAGWSNNGFQSVHLAAPGTNIFSTVPGGYAFFDGTSMAAPLVSGIAAAIWSARPQANAAQVKRALLESVVVVPNREFRTITQGRTDAERALDRLLQIVQ